MRPVSEATRRVTGKSFSRKYISLGRILTHWNDIVGADLAQKAQPVKLRYIKHKEGKKPQASLDIATTSADATLLHYQKDLILERINQIFGERWITAIRFVNVPANTDGAKPKKQRKPLTDAEKNHLSSMLNDIGDPEIRRKLESMGEAMLMEESL
ncbi:MAG: hypothetical protein DHS20C02_05260 [Micavibrio sp.]|nr:MAG: hypothetical protein DHS20C02_05260 [Micavibrio sp.]